MVLGPDGRIMEQGSFQSLKSKNDSFIKKTLEKPVTESSDLETDDSQTSPGKKIIKAPTDDDVGELSRRTGDVAVYSYYLKAIGWGYTVTALMIITIHAFSANFPRE